MDIKVSSRAKHLRITIRPGGELIATMPRGVSRRELDAFLIRRADWIARAVARMKKVPPRVPLPRGQYKRLRKKAEEFILARILKLNQRHKFSYRSVTIRNQKTRWGSCSRQGNLNFNYRLILLPRELADYVIVHELCHLKELNHSKKFWGLMESLLPNALELRRQLRRYDLKIG